MGVRGDVDGDHRRSISDCLKRAFFTLDLVPDAGVNLSVKESMVYKSIGKATDSGSIADSGMSSSTSCFGQRHELKHSLSISLLQVVPLWSWLSQGVVCGVRLLRLWGSITPLHVL